MNEYKSISPETGKSGRQVFRLGPTINFSSKAKRVSLFFTLRTRLIVTFLLVALIPTGMLAYFYIHTTEVALTSSANRTLAAAARQIASSMNSFFADHIHALNEKTRDPNIMKLLNLPADQQPGSSQERLALNFLKTSYMEDAFLSEFVKAYVLINKDGKVLLDTSNPDPDQTIPYLGLDKVDPVNFKLLVETGLPYVSSILFKSNTNDASLYFIARINDESLRLAGILLARYDAALLQAFIQKNNELTGAGSYAVIYDENLLRLGSGSNQEPIYKMVVPLDEEKITKLKDNYRLPSFPVESLSTNNPGLKEGLKLYSSDRPFFTAPVNGNNTESNAAAAIMLEHKPWTIAYFQPQSIFLAPIQDQTRNTLLLAVLIAAITFFIAFIITQRLTRPIIELTRVAEIVASGDLRIKAHESPDEIGILAHAFNMMTSELKRSLEGLERRVMERTSDLALASEQMKYRANQLQTIAEVSRAIASVQDADQLLEQITHLIFERFGFYHVGIFLLDDKNEYAVLQASNSEGGKRMLARGHKLKVGQEGIVGNVTGTGEPRIALDVGSDAIYFDNPDMPNTRSEMTLPLKLGERIIGALDVQSLQPSAFKDEDVSLLGILADQVAIAIENSRLFDETRSTLVELQTLHSQYLASEWTQAIADRGKGGYLYNYGKFTVVKPSEIPDIWESLEGNIPSVIHLKSNGTNGKEGASGSGLIAPITVRGQIIGALNFEETDSPVHWNDEDIQMIKEVADQIGLALENARLIEQTQRRAEREHLVADITTKLRASNDPQVIIQTAAIELRNALQTRHAQVIVKTPDGQKASNAMGKNGSSSEHPMQELDTKGAA